FEPNGFKRPANRRPFRHDPHEEPGRAKISAGRMPPAHGWGHTGARMFRHGQRNESERPHPYFRDVNSQIRGDGIARNGKYRPQRGRPFLLVGSDRAKVTGIKVKIRIGGLLLLTCWGVVQAQRVRPRIRPDNAWLTYTAPDRRFSLDFPGTVSEQQIAVDE